MSTTRIALVDDHRVVQTGLRSYLESFADLEVIGTASSGEEALKNLEEWLPDVVVMDLNMPGGIDGIEATARVRALSPHTQVVVLTAHTDEARVVAALRAGAIGYVRKDSEPEVLVAAVRGAARGQSVLDPAVAPGMGLRNLKERAETLRGKVEIVSSPTSGTRLEVRSPLIPAPVPVEPVHPTMGTWVEPAKLMRAGLRDFVVQAVSLGVILLCCRVPLFRITMENLAEINVAATSLLLGALLLLSWWFGRRTPPSETADSDRRQSKTLSSVVIGIACLSFGEFDGRHPMPWFTWIFSLAMFIVAATGLVEIHQTSEVRRFWHKEARIWLRPVLLMETGILLAVGLAAFDRMLVDLHPVQSCLLLIGGAAFAYIASRQPRQEGVRP